MSNLPPPISHPTISSTNSTSFVSSPVSVTSSPTSPYRTSSASFSRSPVCPSPPISTTVESSPVTKSSVPQYNHQQHRDSSSSQYTHRSESSSRFSASMDSVKGHSQQHSTASSSSQRHSGSSQPQQQQQQQQPPHSPSGYKQHTTRSAIMSQQFSSLSNSGASHLKTGPRPTSEVLPSLASSKFHSGQQQQQQQQQQQRYPQSSQPNASSFDSPNEEQNEAIEKWFEDLQHYEQTLEEMATASLDQSFKEELGAIEQWFRVLSEAERTAALYSLLQSATPVQIRFFITVLTQMSRTDPMASILSPTNPQASMEAQMDAKMASLGIKSSASPAVRQFARQSLGAEAFLSPQSALYGNEDSASSMLAQQRAKLKAQAHRISAPGHLASSLSGGNANNTNHNDHHMSLPQSSSVWDEKRRSVSAQRPKSTGSEHEVSPNPAAGNAANNLAPNGGGNVATAHRTSATGEDILSPLPGGSWASVANTPLAPMFDQSATSSTGNRTGSGDFSGPASLDSNNLATWNPNDSPTSPGGNGATAASGGENRGIVLDDVRKFRRSKTGASLSASTNLGPNDVSSSQSSSLNRSAPAGSANNNDDKLHQIDRRSATSPVPPGSARSISGNWRPSSPANGGSGNNNNNNNNSQFVPASGGPATSPGLLSPQSANMGPGNHQSWRNSASSLNGMAASIGPGISPGGTNSGATSPNLRQMPAGVNPETLALANLLNQQQQQQLQQQMQQLQLQQNLGLMGLSLGGVSPGMNSFPMNGNLANSMPNNPSVQQLFNQQSRGPAPNATSPGMRSVSPGPNPGAAGLGGFNPMNSFSNGGNTPTSGAFPSTGYGAGIGGTMSSSTAQHHQHHHHHHLNASQAKKSPRAGNQNLQASQSTGNSGGGGSKNVVHGSGADPTEDVDLELISDIPAWLRSLRLHKYQTVFENSNWKEMVMLDDKTLEDMGVAALGARRKLLKVFHNVRIKTGMEPPEEEGASKSEQDTTTTSNKDPTDSKAENDGSTTSNKEDSKTNNANSSSTGTSGRSNTDDA